MAMATYIRTMGDSVELARNLRQLEDEHRPRRRRIALRGRPGGKKKPLPLWPATLWSAVIAAGFIVTGWYWKDFAVFLGQLGL